MPTPHKHKDLIIAWASGARIQVQMEDGSWGDCVRRDYPDWLPNLQYRIKPQEEKKPVVRWLWAFDGGNNPWGATSSFYTEEELQRLNPPKAIKLEWSRTEFPE